MPSFTIMIASTCLIAVAVFLLAKILLRLPILPFQLLVPPALMRAAATELDAETLRTFGWVWKATLMAILVIGWLAEMMLIATVIAGVWLLAPRWGLTWKMHGRRVLLRDQLVNCTQALANSARAGQSLAQGLESVSQETPEPLAGELRRMMAEYQLGRPLPEALLETKQRLHLDSFSMFASTVLISLQQGGRVTEALEKISHSLRENQRIERKLAAETAGGWRVVLILTVFPFLFLAGFYVIHPEGTQLMFWSLPGQLLTALIVGLVVISVWWSRKILNVAL